MLKFCFVLRRTPNSNSSMVLIYSLDTSSPCRETFRTQQFLCPWYHGFLLAVLGWQTSFVLYQFTPSLSTNEPYVAVVHLVPQLQAIIAPTWRDDHQWPVGAQGQDDNVIYHSKVNWACGGGVIPGIHPQEPGQSMIVTKTAIGGSV